MTLGLLLGFSAAAFLMGVVLHVVLYAPTAYLPSVWRNLARYALGVSAVMIVIAVCITLKPTIGAWRLFGLEIVLFALTGLGVALGYLLLDD